MAEPANLSVNYVNYCTSAKLTAPVSHKEIHQNGEQLLLE